MGTDLRPEISGRNKYWISKHRYYELKHFCLQYPDWKREYNSYDSIGAIPTSVSSQLAYISSDPTSTTASLREPLKIRIDLVEKAASEADEALAPYILKGVTEGLTYEHLMAGYSIPCSRDMYYDRYRKFFWILSHSQILQSPL